MHNYLDDADGKTHAPDPASAADAMKLNFRTLRREVEESPVSFGIVVDDRCVALAITKLDEALMWMLKGMEEGEV